MQDGKSQGPATSCLADSSNLEALVYQVIRKWMDLKWLNLSPRDFLELDNDKTAEELSAEEILKNGTTYDPVKQCYTTTLPWCDIPVSSLNHKKGYAIAEAWLCNLEAKDPLFVTNFVKAFQDMINWGFIEPVPKKDLGKSKNYHVIATLPVKQPHRIDHQVRIVFQAHQLCENVKSLNSCLFTG